MYGCIFKSLLVVAALCVILMFGGLCLFALSFTKGIDEAAKAQQQTQRTQQPANPFAPTSR